MKYKLINIETKQETLCDKVTIHGVDYHVSNEMPNYKDYYITSITDSSGTRISIGQRLDSVDSDYSECKKVIATTNPNIDIPQVENEVEELAYIHYKSNKHYTTRDAHHFGLGYTKSQQSHPFSEEDMIEFGEWRNNIQQPFLRNGYQDLETERLFQIWKQQKPIKVYYNE